jgi:hypothetical protein
MTTATLTRPSSVDEIRSAPQVEGPRYPWHKHSGSRWMLKRADFVCPVGDGREREAIFAEIARAIGFLSYDVMYDNRGVALEHAEDANPEWELLGDFFTVKTHMLHALPNKKIPADVWVPYAAFNLALGIGDRHNGNALLMRHKTTGELAHVSIDHECKCEDGDPRAYPLRYNDEFSFEAVTRDEFMHAFERVIDRITDAGYAAHLSYEHIAKARDDETYITNGSGIKEATT